MKTKIMVYLKKLKYLKYVSEFVFKILVLKKPVVIESIYLLKPIVTEYNTVIKDNL